MLHLTLQVYYKNREMLSFICNQYIKYSILTSIDFYCLLLASFLKFFFFISRNLQIKLLERDKKYIKFVIFVISFVKNLQLFSIIISLYQSIRCNIVRKVKQFIDFAIRSCRNTKRFIDLRVASCCNTRQFFDLKINSYFIFDSQSSYYLFQIKKLFLKIICYNIRIST